MAELSKRLTDPADLSAATAALVRTDDFRRASFTAHVPDLVRGLFQGLLGREADPEALATYSQRLAGCDVGDAAAHIADSEEFRKRMVRMLAGSLVRSIYAGLLERQPEPRALAYYSRQLSRTTELAPLLTALVRSEEFRRRHLPQSSLRPQKRVAPRAQRTHSFSAQDLEASKLVFLHHPKSGGTMLVKAFDEHEVCPERFNGLRHYPAGELAGYRFFSGHFDLPSVRLIPGRKKIVTMIREPVARLISLYYFQRAHRPEAIEKRRLTLARLANEYSMKEFFNDAEVRMHPAINNSLTRLLVDTLEKDRWEHDARFDTPASDQFIELALRELSSLDAFGIMERFEDSVELICAAAGLDVPPRIEQRQVLEVIMDQEPGLRRIDKEPVTDEIRHAIAELVQIDLSVYAGARELFESRLATLGRRRSAMQRDRRPAGLVARLDSEGAAADPVAPKPHASSQG